MTDVRAEKQNTATSPIRRGWGLGGLVGLVVAAVMLLGTASLSACIEHQFLISPPSLRGITIPLPPPSFADEVLVTIDVEGSVPFGFDNPGTEAFLYEKGTDRGYFVPVDGASYVIYDVLVDIEDNCLETWFVDGLDGDASSVVDYKVQLREGAEACADTSCSAMDLEDACLCLEKWSLGC